ncbi:MAG: helix-turn-helix domain-containing protein [Thermomicrobiales bacterium]
MASGMELTGPITTGQQGVVAALLQQRELPPRQRERLEMVKAAWLGEDIAVIARWSGRTPRTVRRWLTAFREGGVAALAGAPIPGRPPKADAAYLAALGAAVATPPRTLGLPFDAWSSRRLSVHLAETTGVRIAPGWLRVLLHRQRFACGRPKHILAHLQHPEEVAACEAALQAAGEKGGRQPGAL